MIERFTRPEMGAIWDLENKFEIWKRIEVFACEAQAQLGIVPAEASLARTPVVRAVLEQTWPPSLAFWSRAEWRSTREWSRTSITTSGA